MVLVVFWCPRNSSRSGFDWQPWRQFHILPFIWSRGAATSRVDILRAVQDSVACLELSHLGRIRLSCTRQQV